MNGPLIWVILPLLTAAILWVVKTRNKISMFLATGACLFFALTAWLLPVDKFVRLGSINFELKGIMPILGRRLVLESGDQNLVVFIYLTGAIWFFGAIAGGAGRNFFSIGMSVMALSVAALLIEPFLYAALIVEIMVLLIIPALTSTNQTVGRGILRFLIFQTMAVPFILLAGWAAGRLDQNPGDTVALQQVEILLGLGFAFWLAIFPFHNWVPLFFDEVQPYTAGFLLFLLPNIMILFTLDFLDTFSWLRDDIGMLQLLRTAGVIVVVTSGLWAAFERNLARLLGYGVLLENGFFLLAISLGSRDGINLLVMSFVPRFIAMALGSLCLGIWHKNQNSLEMGNLKDELRSRPLVAAGYFLTLLSLGAFPLLAGFPVRQALLSNLSVGSYQIAGWTFISNVGFLVASFRLAFIITKDSPGDRWTREKWPTAVLLTGGVGALLLAGLAPTIFLDQMLPLLTAFPNLW